MPEQVEQVLFRAPVPPVPANNPCKHKGFGPAQHPKRSLRNRISEHKVCVRSLHTYMSCIEGNAKENTNAQRAWPGPAENIGKSSGTSQTRLDSRVLTKDMRLTTHDTRGSAITDSLMGAHARKGSWQLLLSPDEGVNPARANATSFSDAFRKSMARSTKPDVRNLVSPRPTMSHSGWLSQRVCRSLVTSLMSSTSTRPDLNHMEGERWLSSNEKAPLRFADQRALIRFGSRDLSFGREFRSLDSVFRSALPAVPVQGFVSYPLIQVWS